MLRIDAHVHSNCSDGTDTPEDLLVKAKDQGLDAIGAVDHDTFDHWELFRQAHKDLSAAVNGLPMVILGTEISTHAEQTPMHILAYLSDSNRGDLRRILANVKQDRINRLKTMTTRIRADYPITWEEVLSQVKGVTAGRPHLADALVTRGYFPNRSAAFKILGQNSPYYAPRPPVDTFEVVEATLADGGVPVLAHPFSLQRGNTLNPDTLRRLAKAGLAGIEVYHREHSSAERAISLELARELKLFISGGSDYHGDGKPNELGENLMPEPSFHRLVQLGSSQLIGSRL